MTQNRHLKKLESMIDQPAPLAPQLSLLLLWSSLSHHTCFCLVPIIVTVEEQWSSSS